MAAISITGSGHNSGITLYGIHEGNGSFRNDTATVHSQVKLMQQALTNKGYNTQGADGKFGNNTLSAVKAFQKAKGLTQDGYFGKNSLIALEGMIGGHLDPDNCTSSSGGGSTGGGHDLIKNDSSKTYKTMTGTRVNTHSEAVAKINAFAGEGSPLTVAAYINNLNSVASTNTTYTQKDCSGYVKDARNGQGYHGSTTNFNQHSKYFGFISDLGGYNNLVKGMELYQGFRKSASSDQYYMSHVGVYAGKYDFGDGKGAVHAVYQSSPSYTSLAKKTNKASGPNLTSMNTSWNYWAWSKYIKVN